MYSKIYRPYFSFTPFEENAWTGSIQTANKLEPRPPEKKHLYAMNLSIQYMLSHPSDYE